MNIDGKAEKQYTKNYETTFEERVKSYPPEKKEFSYTQDAPELRPYEAVMLYYNDYNDQERK